MSSRCVQRSAIFPVPALRRVLAARPTDRHVGDHHVPSCLCRSSGFPVRLGRRWAVYADRSQQRSTVLGSPEPSEPAVGVRAVRQERSALCSVADLSNRTSSLQATLSHHRPPAHLRASGLPSRTLARRAGLLDAGAGRPVIKPAGARAARHRRPLLPMTGPRARSSQDPRAGNASRGAVWQASVSRPMERGLRPCCARVDGCRRGQLKRGSGPPARPVRRARAEVVGPLHANAGQ